MSLFQRRRARGKTFQGYLDIVCLSSGQMKANTLLPTVLHPWVEESGGMQSPPSSQIRMGRHLLPGQHLSRGLHRSGYPPPRSSDHHR